MYTFPEYTSSPKGGNMIVTLWNPDYMFSETSNGDISYFSPSVHELLNSFYHNEVRNTYPFEMINRHT